MAAPAAMVDRAGHELSPAEVLASMPDHERRAWVEAQDPDELAQLKRSWRFWGRPSQRPPDGYHRWWLMCGGRGAGKTAAGAEWVFDRSEAFAATGVDHVGGLMSRTFSDVMRTMVDGPSGLDHVAKRRGHRIVYARTAPVVQIPGLRTTLEIRSADQPEGARGRNWSSLWCEELSAWRQRVDEMGGTAFTNADLSLRIDGPGGLVPAGCITTTPRSITLMRDLIAGAYGVTAVTRSTLFDNVAHLAPEFVEAVLARYQGTRLGLQEIMGIILDDIEGALWTAAMIDAGRVFNHPPLMSPVVGVDPPGEAYGAECGIVVGAVNRDAASSSDRHLYVLDDASISGAPEVWAAQVVATVRKWGASKVVAEVNNGHDMVRAVIHNVDPTIIVDKVTATRGKKLRAEPVAQLYDMRHPDALDEDGHPARAPRVHHVGIFGDLEGQQVTWVEGDPSPDRLDAMCWLAHDLLPWLQTPPAQHTAPGVAGRRVATGATSHMRRR